VLADPLAITGGDPDHSADADGGSRSASRIATGSSLSHTDEGNLIRIISARAATRPER